jgi:uncharacterized protein (TIGR02677 family)
VIKESPTGAEPSAADGGASVAAGSVLHVTDAPDWTGFSPDEQERALAFHHLAAEGAGQYVAIMRVMADDVGGLMSDWSASELAPTIVERTGLELDVDTLEARLRYLVERGNLARSPREAHARTIAEYQQVRARYQVTPRGERVHRLVAEVLGDTGDTAEISAELLRPLLDGLERLAALTDTDIAATPQHEIAERIQTVFAQFDQLVESTRQFYTHLGELLGRVHIDRDLFLTYKGALLAYLQSFVEDVRRAAPRARDVLTALTPRLAQLCTRAAPDRGLEAAGVRRSRGLEVADWDGVALWFQGDGARTADADRIVDLSVEAIRTLVSTINRLSLPVGAEVSRYGDLLRLAGWFAQADDDTAHAIWAAAFGLYPARHLGFVGDGVDIPPTASFWSAPSAQVPVSLRERGERAVRGRSGARADFAAAKSRRLAERDATDRARRQAADELAAAFAGGATAVTLSDAGRGLLLELQARALATPEFVGGGEAAVTDHRLALHAVVRRAPGTVTTVTGRSGRLTLHDLSVRVEAIAADVEEVG